MDLFNQTLENIKQFLVPYLKEHGYTFDKASKIICLNPKHKEETPSMGLIPNSESKLIHCFGCGKTMNIFHVAEVLECKPSKGAGLISDTIPYLSNKFSITYDPKSLGLSDVALENLEYREVYENVARIANEIADYTHTKERGWTEEICKDLCVFTVKWSNLAKELYRQHGYTEPYLVSKDILSSIFDEDKITYTLKDTSGRVCGFSGRNLKFTKGSKTVPKFRNTSGEVPIFMKASIAYNLYKAKDNVSRRLDIFEGYGDVITAVQHGYTNCIATCGTTIQPSVVDEIKSLGFTHINIVFDSDPAGLTKMRSNLDTLSNRPGLRVTASVLPFPDDQPMDKRDPEDYIYQFGIDQYKSVKTQTSFDLRIEDFKNDGLDKDEITRKAIPFIIGETSPIERDYMCRKLSSITGMSEDDLKEEVRTRSNRAVKDVANNLINKLRTADDAIDIENMINDSMRRIKEGSSKKDYAAFHSNETVSHLELWFDEIKTNNNAMTGWNTGWNIFNDPLVLGGIPKKDSIFTFAGAPNHGKSSILINLAKNLILPEFGNKNLSVILWYLDDSRNVAWSKLLASMCKLPILDIRCPNRRINKDDKLQERYNGWFDFLKGQVKSERIVVKGHDIGNDISSAERLIKYTQDKTGNNVVFIIDALNDMVTGNGDIDSNERYKYMRVYEWFQRTTEMLQYTVVTCCHVTKAGISKGKPTLGDISESGKVLFSSKVLGMVYSDLDYKTQMSCRDSCRLYWTDEDDTESVDNKKPILELQIVKSKESSFKGPLYFKHKADACWLEEISASDVKDLKATNTPEAETTEDFATGEGIAATFN